MRELVRDAADADLVVKASGVGVLDERARGGGRSPRGRRSRIFWDVDAPATLARLEADQATRSRRLVPALDLVLTYGGGDPVVERYRALGAAHACRSTTRSTRRRTIRSSRTPASHADLAFLGNRLPDRERASRSSSSRGARARRTFLLGGSGWEGKPLPANVRLLGHVGTRDTTRSTPRRWPSSTSPATRWS